MFKITKKGILYVATAIFFIISHIFISQYKIKTEINNDIMKEINCNKNLEQIEKTEKVKLPEKDALNRKEVWQIEIPKISLNADIREGTTKETLNQYVGHFIETQKENGNIGLAAHNRGYEVNYFHDLKLLQKGDEIKYRYNEFEKIYEVEKCRIIKDTDWEYLDNTEENMLTLITCVENQPEYRRCIQAVEKKEEKD